MLLKKLVLYELHVGLEKPYSYESITEEQPYTCTVHVRYCYRKSIIHTVIYIYILYIWYACTVVATLFTSDQKSHRAQQSR